MSDNLRRASESVYRSAEFCSKVDHTDDLLRQKVDEFLSTVKAA